MSYQIATDIPKLDAPRFTQKMALISNATIDPFNKTPYIYTKEKIWINIILCQLFL